MCLQIFGKILKDKMCNYETWARTKELKYIVFYINIFLLLFNHLSDKTVFIKLKITEPTIILHGHVWATSMVFHVCLQPLQPVPKNTVIYMYGAWSSVLL